MVVDVTYSQWQRDGLAGLAPAIARGRELSTRINRQLAANPRSPVELPRSEPSAPRGLTRRGLVTGGAAMLAYAEYARRNYAWAQAPAGFADVTLFGANRFGGAAADGAINAALAQASNVYMPPGTYLVHTGLSIPGSSKRLFGAGIGLTTITVDANVTGIQATDRNIVQMADITFEMNSHTQPAALFAGCSNVDVFRCQFQNTTQSAFSFQQDGGGNGCTRSTLRNCRFTNVGNHAVVVSLSSEIEISGCIMQNIAWSGINVAGGGYTTIVANEIDGTLDASGFGAIRTDNTVVYPIVVANRMINVSRGLMHLGTIFGTMSNNIIFGTVAEPIFLQSNNTGPNTSCSSNNVSNNTIQNGWNTAGGTRVGIQLSQVVGDCQNNSVVGNGIWDTRGPAIMNSAVSNTGVSNNYIFNNYTNVPCNAGYCAAPGP